MLSLFEGLDKIKAKPGLYLGHPSVSNLLMSLNGYEFAREQFGIELTEAEERFHDEFQP
jgi:hypothetical protein